MNALEMHHTVLQDVQKQAANKTRKFLREEVDMALNGSVEALIKDGIRRNDEGFYEINELYAEALAPLKEVGIPIRMEQTNPDRYLGHMPADFRFLLSAAASVGKACDNETTPTHNETWTNYIIPLATTKTEKPFWRTFTFNIVDGDPITNTGIAGYSGYSSLEELYRFATLIQELLWAEGINAFWETYEGVYRPNCLIIPSPSALVTGVTIDGTTVTVTTAQTSTKTFNEADNVVMASVRQMKSAVSHNMRTTPYYATSADSPLIEMFGQGGIYLYSDNSFTVRELQTTYLRKPRKIDVNLSRGCDLHESFHKDICDRTVISLLQSINDPNWQQNLQRKVVQQPL